MTFRWACSQLHQVIEYVKLLRIMIALLGTGSRSSGWDEVHSGQLQVLDDKALKVTIEEGNSQICEFAEHIHREGV